MKDLVRNVAVDSGFFVAMIDSEDDAHDESVSILARLSRLTNYFTTESCLAEVNYVLPGNQQSRKQLHEILNLLNISIVPLEVAHLSRLIDLMDKYQDLPMDFADGTLVVACEKMNIQHVLTFDRKDFSIYKPSHCNRLKILP